MTTFFFSFRRIQTKREQSNIIISFIISHFISRSIYFLFHSCILKSALGIQYHLTQGTVLVWSFYSVSLTRWYCLREGSKYSKSPISLEISAFSIASTRVLLSYNRVRKSIYTAVSLYSGHLLQLGTDTSTPISNRSIQLYHCIVGNYYN